MKLNKRQLYVLGQVMAPLFFGVTLNPAQCRHFAECYNGLDIESVVDVMDAVDEYMLKRREILRSRQLVFMEDKNI